MLFVKSLNVRNSLAGMISLLLLAASVLGFNSLIPTAVALPIDDITTGGGGGTTATTTSGNTSLNLATTANVELEEEPFAKDITHKYLKI